MTYSYIPQDRK